MLYKFKSRASSGFMMLELHARQLLEIIGKAPERKGIVTLEQMPGAIAALEAALAREGHNAHNNDDFAVGRVSAAWKTAGDWQRHGTFRRAGIAHAFTTRRWKSVGFDDCGKRVSRSRSGDGESWKRIDAALRDGQR